MRYDAPREVGPDRIVNSVAAKERYGAPCIVVDFGTSTNFDVVSAAGEYVGGDARPGHRDLDGSALRASARPDQVDFVEPSAVIGKTTAQALSRARLRLRRRVDGIVERIRGEVGARRA